VPHIVRVAQAAAIDLLSGILARAAGVLLPSSHSPVDDWGHACSPRRINDAAEESEISANESLASIDRPNASPPGIAAERRAIESALRDSEERFRAVWEATSEAMALSDPAGVVIAVNPAYCALYGLIPEQAVGQSFAIIFPEESRATAVEQYHAVFADPNSPPSYESRVQHADGSERFVEAHADFLVRDGERVAMISAIRDITERKRAERVQQDFIAMASHDLLTPVTVLRARAQLLQRRQTYDEASVASILEQASRMERLITDLRELVQVEGGRLALRREPVDLVEIAHEALTRARTQETGNALRIEAPRFPIVGFWDRDRLGQVLDNLIGNAIKYSPQGGEIAIWVEATNAEGLVRIEDHGIGIASDVLPQLFERFYQGQDPGVSTGLGLGLYIARMLVEAHGGRIWAESEPGQGSTFVISLPR
jgi:PAS domain S-box-containing protein